MSAKRKRKEIKPTLKMLDALRLAQFTWTRDMLNDALTCGYSDDGYDYLGAALELSQIMMQLHMNDDLTRLERMLNAHCDDEEALAQFACDGVAPAFYDLKPRSLDID